MLAKAVGIFQLQGGVEAIALRATHPVRRAIPVPKARQVTMQAVAQKGNWQAF